MADETGLSLSDFIRRKAAANEKYFAELINENSKLKDEIKELRVKSSFGLPTLQKEGITINLSPEKQKVYDTILLNQNVIIDPDEDDSDLRPMILGEKIIFALGIWANQEYFVEFRGKINKLEPRLVSVIKEGLISREKTKKAYPGKEF